MRFHSIHMRVPRGNTKVTLLKIRSASWPARTFDTQKIFRRKNREPRSLESARQWPKLSRFSFPNAFLNNLALLSGSEIVRYKILMEHRARLAVCESAAAGFTRSASDGP